jgi:glutathione S-transferase
MAEFVIHTVPGSPFARAVAATLEEKGASWRVAAIAPGALKAQPHLSRHPFGRMPVVDHGDFSLYETQAILRYIDRVHPGPPLTPADPHRAARMDQVMGISDWYLFLGGGNVIAFQRVVGPRLVGLTPDEDAIVAAMPKAMVAFDALGVLLGGQDFFGGEQFTLADILLGAQMSFLAQTPEWARLTAANPNVAAWMDRVDARPSFVATTWDAVAAVAAAA